MTLRLMPAAPSSCYALPALVLALLLSGCHQHQETPLNGQPSRLSLPKAFGEHWYDGKAEINRYQLSQSRYGHSHQGEAVLIFVTEPFLKHRQVKADNPQDPDALTILKLNATRNFNTGAYPYSILSSTFSPVEIADYPLPLKLTSSVQEWCGHTFTQLNLEDSNYRSQLHSYFQVEGDRQALLPAALPEEGIFIRIRLSPDSLPTGRIQIIPSQIFCRFQKQAASPQPAQASLETVDSSAFSRQPHQLYRLRYSDIDRELTIAFSPEHPHGILGWEEGSASGVPPRTTAILAHTQRLSYWSLNRPSDAASRNETGFRN